MALTYVPLLSVQRDLYRIPRGRERFEAYLQTMVDAQSGDLRLPLAGMNPMAKDHVPALLDRYLEMGADEIAAEVTSQIPLPADRRVTMVISDDAMGGWTNRYASEFSARFETRPLLRRGWIVVTLWTSEPPAEERVRQDVAAAIHRAAYIDRQGFASTLRERMAQEGFALTRAGITPQVAGAERAREIVEPLLGATDMRTAIECLFGDPAARSLGFTERGLPLHAGLALAVLEEKNKGRSEAAL